MLSSVLLAVIISCVSARFNTGMLGRRGIQGLGGSINNGVFQRLNHGGLHNEGFQGLHHGGFQGLNHASFHGLDNQFDILNCHSNGIGETALDGLTEYANGRQGARNFGLFGNNNAMYGYGMGRNHGNNLGFLNGGYGRKSGNHKGNMRGFGSIGNSLGGGVLGSHFGGFDSYGFGNGQSLSNIGYKGGRASMSHKGGMNGYKKGGNEMKKINPFQNSGLFGYGNDNNFGVFSGGNQKNSFNGFQKGNRGGYGKGGQRMKGSGLLSGLGRIGSNFDFGIGFEGLTDHSTFGNGGY